jgi:hypothetical protein
MKNAAQKSVPLQIITILQWMQQNSKLELRHSKRGREYGKGKGSKTAESLPEHV